MSKIVISGYYGFANAGDEAMLTAIIKALRGTEDKVQLTVISGNPLVTAARHEVKSIHRFAPFSIISEIKSCDLLLSGGGSLLQDVTSRKSLLYYLSVLALGWLFNKKVMLFAQGIGPIRDELLRRLTKFVCGKADLITVRDIDSLAELQKIGVQPEKVHLTADSVLTLPQADTKRGREILRKFSIPEDKPLIAVSVREWGNNENYIKEIAQAVDTIAAEKNAFIILLPLQYAVDTEICRKLQNNIKSSPSVIVDHPCDTEEFLSIIGNCMLLVGMRLHALIFAAVMEIPFVAVSYDPKIDGFVKEVAGVSAGKVESLSAESIIKASHTALLHNSACWEQLKALRIKAMQNISMAFALLNDKHKI